MCNVHTCAMIAEYLTLAATKYGDGSGKGIPNSAKAFLSVTPNAAEETAPAAFNVANLQDSTVFTKAHLIKTMAGAIDLLAHEQVCRVWLSCTQPSESLTTATGRTCLGKAL
jgi:hypothetical protein